MNITSEQQLVLDKIHEYFTELGYKNIVVYGSYVEQFHGFDVQPNDIDVTLVIDEEPPEKRHKTFFLGFDIPVNVEILHRKSFEAELRSMQPKYFMCISNAAILKDIDSIFQDKLQHEIRSCISSLSSKAFDKGKKKLTVENDYDEVLGLKNLFHSFKFPYYAFWKYLNPENDSIQNDINELNEIRNEIYEIYNNSTGTLEERCTKLLEVIKPKHNELMTKFRQYFPKEVS